ncbi:glucose-1-phosphate cytidylyltransferase [Acidisoma sp. 7E03]
MKVVLLAGGFGTRLSEETQARPKPLVEIGGKPIIWHIMKIYSHYGFNEFIVCAGYKGDMIKEYFVNYILHSSNVTVDVRGGTVRYESESRDPWRVTVVDTGLNTMTGGRIKRILPYIGDDREFLMTYGDGVTDLDIPAVIALHRAERRLATVTGAQPPGRFGQLSLSGNAVTSFHEKPKGEGGWINAGFFVLPKNIGDYIDGDDTMFEHGPLEALSAQGQLSLYRHEGFWRPMDSLRDKIALEEMWSDGKAPWKIWA